MFGEILEENESSRTTNEVSFRVLGNEVLAMQLFSKSKTKNWIFFSVFALLLLAVMLNQLMPVIVTLSSLMN